MLGMGGGGGGWTVGVGRGAYKRRFRALALKPMVENLMKQ